MSTHHRPVRNYMTPLPHTIGADQSLASASHRMSQLGVRHLPVLQGGALCGVVSERDILFLRSLTNVDPERTSVEEAMSPEPFVVGPEMPLGAVARSMAKRRIGSAVVVEGTDVVGILTTTDALAVLADLADLADATAAVPATSPLLPSVVRARVLEDHIALRALLATVTSHVKRVLDTGNASDEELPLHARELYHTLIRHLDLEDLILAPALRCADAWGEARSDALVEEHRLQREQLYGALRELEDGGAVKLALSLQSFAPALVEEMAREEKHLLTEDLLRDGIARVSSGGMNMNESNTGSPSHASTASTASRGRVLIIDDERNARSALAESLCMDGYETRMAADGEEGMSELETFEPDLVLTDLKMPRLDGIRFVEQGLWCAPRTAFIVMTAFGSIASAVEAIKKGAEAYLTKPLDLETVSALVERSMEKVLLRREATRLRDEVRAKYTFEKILGDHPSMQRLFKQVAQVAPSRATVLIQGESGTGKELVAAAIHQRSKRSQGPMVRLNCAALAETLLESELFGHEKGSFAGAAVRRDGKLMQADGGTLFLDEVSEIPMALQAKLLRFLEEREFERVGANQTIRVDVRIVAATNRDLGERVRAGTFREDLYYRLHVVTLNLPPLRGRRSDIALLAHHFLQKYNVENERTILGFTDAALRRLVSLPWPGNVRELENVVERAVGICKSETLDVCDFPALPEHREGDELAMLVPGITMHQVERLAILRTLDAVGGSTAKAAEILGISRRKIQYRLKEWGITARDVGARAIAI